MSPILAAFLRSTVLPAVLAGIPLFFIGSFKDPMRARLQALVVALAYGLGSYLLLDRLSFPPSDVSESLSYAGLALALFVIVSPKDSSTRYGVRALFVLLLGALILWHIHSTLVSNPVHQRNLLAFFFLGLGLWSIVERSSRLVSAPTLILLPLISATGTSLLLLFAASASFSQLVTVLCGQLGLLLLLALLFPARVSIVGLLPFLSIFVVFFMVAGHFYLDVNPWHLIYLCFPYLLLWIRAWLPIPKGAIAEASILGILSAAPLGYFLWTVFQASGPLY